MIDHWTNKDVEYLEDVWGQNKIKSIATKLNRTEVAIILKAKRLRLMGCYKSSEYINANEVSKIMRVDRHTVTDFWVEKCGLKAWKRALMQKEMWFISLDGLMKWLEKNKDKWDSRKVELYALCLEPQWLKDKRKSDMNLPEKHHQKWTSEEEIKVINYYKFGKTHKEIGSILNRSENSVQRKVSRLKEKGLLNKKNIKCKWSLKEENLFKNLERKGLSDIGIAKQLGRERYHITDHRRNLRNKGLYDGRKPVASY